MFDYGTPIFFVPKTYFLFLTEKNLFGSGTCAIRTLFLPTPSFHQLIYWLRYLRVRKEHRSFPPRPSTMQYYLLRYVCEQCGAGPQRPSPSISTPHFHQAILLAPVRVQAMWRWSCSMQLQRPSPSFSTPPFHHTKILAPVRVREEYHSSPPRPSTVTDTIGSGTCAKRTPFFSTPPFHHTLLVLAHLYN
jgi:hypothetical protein